jgi:hypothetical protein
MTPLKRSTSTIVAATVLASCLVVPVRAGAFESLITLPSPGAPPQVTVPVKLPPLPPVSVPVKAPTPPPVKPPSPPVKVPVPPVKLPVPPVKLPVPPVKLPAPPVKAPVKAPAKAPALPVKAPSVPVKVPAPKAPGAGANTTASGGRPSAHVPLNVPARPVPRSSPPAPSTSSSSAGAAVSPSNSLGGGPNGSPGAPGSAPLSSYGTGGRAFGAPATRRARAAALRRERAVKQLVQSLRGCLGSLPEQLRLVLELRTGVEVPHSLAPSAVAAFVHVPVRQVAPLELRALGQLRATAGTDGCAETTTSAQPSLQLVSYFAPGIAGGDGPASGGVEGARYSKSPSPPSIPSADQSGSVLGLTLPAHAGGLLLWILAALAGSMLLAFLFADGMGTGPRHRHWRLRWLSPPRRVLRHMRSRL